MKLFTSRAYYLSAMAVLAISTSAFFLTPFMGIAAIPAIVFIAIARVMSPAYLNISVYREVEKKVILHGDTLQVRVVIKNRGDGLPMLKIANKLPDNLKLVAGSNIFVAKMRKEEERTFVFTVSPSLPGRYRFNDIDVEASDPLQLFCRRMTVHSYDEVIAYPYVETTRQSLLIVALKNEPGENISRRQGEGAEFYSVRSYTPGDRLKRINWKASAKYEGLYTNQYASELAGEMMIVLDSRFELLSSQDEEEQFRLCTSAAGTVAYSSLMARNKVGLMIMGDLLEKVAPSYGYKQLRKILTVLSDFRAGRRWQVSKVSNYLRLLYPRVSEVTLVTPLVDEEVIRAVSALHEELFNVILISPDIWSAKLRSLKNLNERVALKLFLVRRRMMISQAKRFALIVDWDAATPLSHTLRAARREVRIVKA